MLQISKERHVTLKALLEEKRRELVEWINQKKRDVRVSGSERSTLKRSVNYADGTNDFESATVGVQEEIDWVLIQMKSDTLNSINRALHRLELGSYGNCADCRDEISEKRLKALPFAIRCKDCEEARERKTAGLNRLIIGLRLDKEALPQ